MLNRFFFFFGLFGFLLLCLSDLCKHSIHMWIEKRSAAFNHKRAGWSHQPHPSILASFHSLNYTVKDLRREIISCLASHIKKIENRQELKKVRNITRFDNFPICVILLDTIYYIQHLSLWRKFWGLKVAVFL